jgi:antitoxin (DNA-binding transcriptional repressor) of toxin-antitoxin stability system
MQTIDINIAQPKLHTIIHQLNDGPIVLSENGEPIAMLIPCPKTPSKEPRKPGMFAGQIIMHDNFDDPLPHEFKDAFGL